VIEFSYLQRRQLVGGDGVEVFRVDPERLGAALQELALSLHQLSVGQPDRCDRAQHRKSYRRCRMEGIHRKSV